MAASSLGRCPLVRTARRSLAFKASTTLGGVDDPAGRFATGGEKDNVLPIAPPALTDRRIFLVPLAGLKGLQRPRAVLGIAGPRQDHR